MSSIDHLTGVLGRRDWPGDLTLEEDRKALAGHEWEFENKIGFVYAVMNKTESEIIGCVYIYPSRLDDYNAEIVMWVTEKEFSKGTDEILFHTIMAHQTASQKLPEIQKVKENPPRFISRKR